MTIEPVHIVGGGVIGLCSAWYLKERGFDVTVIGTYFPEFESALPDYLSRR